MLRVMLDSTDWEDDVACDYCGERQHRVLIPSVRGTRHVLVECICGLRFFSPRLSWAWLYDQIVCKGACAAGAHWCWEKGALVVDPPLPREEMWRALRTLASTWFGTVQALLPTVSAPRVYDVGASIGWLVQTCLQLGAHPLSGGCDLCPTACRLGAEKLHVLLDQGEFRTLQPRAAPYDIVFANDYVEHTYTPHADLQKMHQIVNPQGVLHLKTFLDDLDEPLGRKMLSPPVHAIHFTRVTLQRAITEAGWNILDWHEDLVWAQVTVVARAR